KAAFAAAEKALAAAAARIEELLRGNDRLAQDRLDYRKLTALAADQDRRAAEGTPPPSAGAARPAAEAPLRERAAAARDGRRRRPRRPRTRGEPQGTRRAPPRPRRRRPRPDRRDAARAGRGAGPPPVRTGREGGGAARPDRD